MSLSELRAKLSPWITCTPVAKPRAKKTIQAAAPLDTGAFKEPQQLMGEGLAHLIETFLTDSDRHLHLMEEAA